MPLASEIWPILPEELADKKLGKKKHGGPLLSLYPDLRSDALRRDSQFGLWGVDGTPFVRSHFRAADPEEDEYFKRREPPSVMINRFVEEYKHDMIAQGKESEIIGSPDAAKERHTDLGVSSGEGRLPDEAVETLRKAFAEKDPDAMGEALLALQKYDPIEKGFDERIQWWLQELAAAWGPELQKDTEDGKRFIFQTLDPLGTPAFRDLKRNIEKQVEYEKTKETALRSQRESQDESLQFPAAVDLTDSSMTVIQARSNDQDWENHFGVMGAHPGVLFGMHTSSCMEAMGLRGVYGDIIPDLTEGAPDSADFELRYPRAKGRQPFEGAPRI